MHVDRTFDSNHDMEVLSELPPTGRLRQLYFPGATPIGGRDGILVKVTPQQHTAKPWIGVFAFGMIAPKSLSAVFSHPDPDKLCVVAQGAGYIVTAPNPETHELVDAEPILGVYPVAPLGLLVFADYLRLTAHNRRGRAWQTERLSWDGLRVDEIDGYRLRGKAWSAPYDRYVDFTVDLRTGAHEGGASPLS